MNKKFILGIALISMFYTGCEQKDTVIDSKETQATDEKTETTVDKVANSVITHVESTAKKAEQIAKDVQESTSPVVKDIAKKVKVVQKEISETTMEDAKSKIEEVTAPLMKKVQQAVTTTPDGKKLYNKCIGCHGQNGEKKALNKSEIIKNWDATKIASALKGYKEGTYGGAMKGVMKSQVATLSDSEIELLSEYITTLK